MRRAALAALLTAALGTTGCETYHGRSYGGYDYVGADYDRIGNDCGYFAGSGGPLLDPWLACTREGQALVRDLFDRGRDRRISDRTADRANIWFRRHADTDRDMRLTDPEIKAGLVNHARHSGLRR